jgi:hypothetical protein
LADLASEATIDEIGGTLRFTRAGEEAARQTLVSSTNTNALWAALWVYASAGTDPEPLRPLLTNSDPSLRAMAAAILVSLGDAQGFDELRKALTDESSLLGAHPPRSIQTYVLGILSQYISADGMPAEPATEEGLPAAATDWSTWMEQHAFNMQFEPSSGTWSAP